MNRDEILALMAELNRSLGQTFVIVTHDPALAAIAQRVVTMRDGRITSVEDARSGSDNDEQGGASDE